MTSFCHGHSGMTHTVTFTHSQSHNRSFFTDCQSTANFSCNSVSYYTVEPDIKSEPSCPNGPISGQVRISLSCSLQTLCHFSAIIHSDIVTTMIYYKLLNVVMKIMIRPQYCGYSQTRSQTSNYITISLSFIAVYIGYISLVYHKKVSGRSPI